MDPGWSDGAPLSFSPACLPGSRSGAPAAHDTVTTLTGLLLSQPRARYADGHAIWFCARLLSSGPEMGSATGLRSCVSLRIGTSLCAKRCDLAARLLGFH